jgi:heat shock protein HslJ
MKIQTKLCISILVIIVVSVLVLVAFNNSKNTNTTEIPGTSNENAHDAVYLIDNQSVTLVHGLSEIEVAPSSNSKITTQYFGNEVTADFDGDGQTDSAFIVTQNTGGSGTFYYVVARLNTPHGPVGSQGLFLGDRIAPQIIELATSTSGKPVLVVNYADRGVKDSFATPPSVEKTLHLLLDTKTMQFGEIVQNFEGEADPARMTLSMKKWNWINTQYSNDTTVVPKIPEKFVLTFKDGQTFSATTDCNSVGGNYMLHGNIITFTKIVSTLMFCEGSQEQDFTKMLSEVQTYHFTSKGELVFDLKFDSGSMIFR